MNLSCSQVHAKYKGHYETPTELRGNWYQWVGDDVDQFDHYKINKHSVYLNGYLLYSKHHHKNDTYYMYIKNYKKLGHNTYDFSSKYKEHQSFYWLSRKSIKGMRVLKNYNNSGDIRVYTRQKIHHDYSYFIKNKQEKYELGK